MNMNSRNSSSNGEKKELNLPSGYKFSPTGLELLEFYLIPKLKGETLPFDYIIDLDSVYEFEPQHLPFSESKYARANELFVFTNDSREKSVEGGGIPSASKGRWEVYEENVAINGGGGGGDEVVGLKTKLMFHDVNGNPSDWRMHEFRCHPDRIPAATNMKNYIICKIKLRKKEEERLFHGTNGGFST